MSQPHGDDEGSPTFDPDTGTYRARYDRETESPSSAVISLVAAVIGEDSTQEPLYGVIDPDALDELFAPTQSGASRTDGLVRFTYHDHVVTVYADGVVEVDPSVDN